ncbi:hypothetical protein AX15_001762 [Amanita polypyramis BW_CC]|nr:hypothetical protein AX15_001762 [Amanita polypyramis BW_CC]
MQPALDYLRPSPVRGQLEPPDPNTHPGWRYIQTTDTPNEFKVLLPPGTAAMYEQLLKFEALELSRKQSISWDRIMQIRHLKDRMIRKCQRLSKSSYHKKLSKGEALTFQTVMAPADFRVKEMEKWFREQHRRTTSLVRRQTEPVRTTSLNGHPNMPVALPPTQDFGRLPPSERYHSLPSSSRKLIPISPIWSEPRPKVVLPPAAQSVGVQQSEPPQRHASLQVTKAASVRSNSSPDVFSPPALPILLRSQRSALELEFDRLTNNAGVRTGTRPDSSEPSLPSISHRDATVASMEVGISHRRSCIKRSSIGDIHKTVSWADGSEWENQLSKYANAAKEAQSSGRKWEEIRGIYLEQVSGLDTLYSQVAQNLANLRLESEHLQRVEGYITQQREALRATFQSLEQKQSLLQSKVQEALQEADHVLSTAGIEKAG